MQEAENAKPPVTRLLERYAERYMVLVLLIAAGTWFLTSSTVAMLAVLVASCPCALVLAAPATSIAAIAVGEPPRHSGQGSGLPGEARDRRCRGVRQDRHRDRRPAAAGRGAAGARRRSRTR